MPGGVPVGFKQIPGAPLDGSDPGAGAPGAVTSVFGRTGDVVAAASDYDASQIDNDSLVAGAFVSDALNTLNASVTALAAGIAWKQSVKLASAASIADLSSVTVADFDGTGQGITLVEDDRVLVKDTASIDGVEALDAKRNGIYVVGVVAAGSAPLTRATDYDTSAKVVSAANFVNEGTSADIAFVQTADGATLDTDSLTIVAFTQLANIPAVFTLSAGRNADATDIYLRGSGNVPTNQAGYVIPFDANITGISAASDGAETWVAEVRKNDAAAVIASLSLVAVAKDTDNTLDVDVNDGDEIQFFCNGTSINRPSITIYLKKR